MSMCTGLTYKGFITRPSSDDKNWLGLFFVREDGQEICCGQTRSLQKAVEGYLREPLPTWMTGKPPAMSPYADIDHIRNTCSHNIPLTDRCWSCIESYGSARL